MKAVWMMRTLAARHVVALVLVGCVLAQTAPGVAAEEPPPDGFTDGIPAGGDDAQTAAVEPTAVAAAPSTRYFGRGAYVAIRDAAIATNPSCTITDEGLIALMLAPVFKESSSATSPSSAPSPMTLSRYDEWTGNKNATTGDYITSSNADANFGLYAFRNPYTPYSRSFWHPGIGIWQYDSAGLGAPFNAVERMNAGVVGSDVASIVASGYCNAGGTGQDQRFAAWRPWGYPCNLCESAFQDLSGHRNPSKDSGFEYLELVDGIDALGGTQQRTCSINGGTSIPCWYVDPARAQGATGWATLNADDGDPTKPPTPLSRPFYVYSSNGQEYRHWLREDTGYQIDVSAYRRLGHNARPRSTDSESGLQWSNTSGLCDKSTGRGRCDPAPPSGVQVRFHTVNGSSYRPLVGDFDDDGVSDVLWYAPGPTSDDVWWSDRGGGFSSTRTSVDGDYEPMVGDVDGDGTDDVVWYGDDRPSYVWRFTGNRTFTSSTVQIPAGRRTFLADIGGDGTEDIVVYGPGGASDHVITWRSGGFSTRSISVNGVYQPVVGDFDGNGADDIFWYAPGAGADSLWRTFAGGQIQSSSHPVNGTYRPFVGDFDGNGASDIMWYGPGSAVDYTWFGQAGGTFVSGHTPVNGEYQPIVADLSGDGRDDVIWYAPGSASDHWWRFGANRSLSSTPLSLSGTYVPKAGTFGSGRDGVLWYGPGSTADALWYS